MLNRRITIYQNVRENVGSSGTFADFLQLCAESRDSVEELRRTTDPQLRRELKQQLPCATISGLFVPTRRKENLVEHSGLICVDIDHVADCTTLLKQLERIDCVAFASRSVSGNGVFAVVPIEWPEKHREHFEALRRFFAEMGIEIDRQCSDTTRLRVCSYDTEAFLRQDAVPFRGLWSEPPRLRKYSFADNDDATLCRVRRCVEQVLTRGLNITETYCDWLRVGFSLASLGEPGREFYHAISSLSGKYRPDETDRKFTDLLKQSRGTVGLGTFFEITKNYGI